MKNNVFCILQLSLVLISGNSSITAHDDSDYDSGTEYFSCEEDGGNALDTYAQHGLREEQERLKKSESFQNKVECTQSSSTLKETDRVYDTQWQAWNPPRLTYSLEPKRQHSSYWSWLGYTIEKPYYQYKICNVVDKINTDLAQSSDATISPIHIETLNELLKKLYKTNYKAYLDHTIHIRDTHPYRWFVLKEYSKQFAERKQSDTGIEPTENSFVLEKLYVRRTYTVLAGAALFGVMALILNLTK